MTYDSTESAEAVVFPWRLSVWLLSLACVTIFGLVQGLQVRAGGNTWGYSLIWGLSLWYLFLPVGAAAIWLGHRYRDRTWRHIALHATAGLAMSALHPVLVIYFVSAVREPRWAIDVAGYSLPYLRFWYAGDFLLTLLVYVLVVTVAQALIYYRSYQQEQLRAAQLESRLLNARLSSLKMQMHPHFLFNVLHSISALQMLDVNLAQKMTTLLGDFLRMTLNNADREEITLAEELEFLRSYLTIEQMRFGDRLRVRVEVPNELLDSLVPQLILQPIVENAVRHGIAPYGLGGEVAVRAEHMDGRLRLIVQDSGPGLTPGKPIPETHGMGLANTRNRLSQLRPPGDLCLNSIPGGGFQVTIAIPYRPAPPEAQ